MFLNVGYNKIAPVVFGNNNKKQVEKDDKLQENGFQTNPLGLKEAQALKAQIPVNKTFEKGFIDLGKIKTTFDRDLYCYQLANGQKVFIMPKKGPTIVKTYIKTGSMNESDKQRGISHFVEHNLFNGSKNIKPGVFFNKVSEMGGNTNASTNFAQTDYYIHSF